MTTNHDDMTSALDFNMILASVTSADKDERERLRTIADKSELAHDAYTLGIHHLQQEEYALATRRLRTAVQHGLDDAVPLLRHCERLVADDSEETVTEPAAAADDSGIDPDAGASLPRTATSGDATHSAAVSGRPDRPAATAVAEKEGTTSTPPGGVVLQASHESLTHGVSSSVPGTIFILALTGGLALGPREGHRILFGRSRPDVHVCIGEDDRRVSRHHGTLEYHDGQWRVQNKGQLPIRIDEQLLFHGEEPLPLDTGYTTIFVGTQHRQHLIEVFVTGPDGEVPVPLHTAPTELPSQWQLSPTEKLVLIVFAQRYLLREVHPQPLSWRATADHLADLQPEANWTPKKIEHVVAGVRARLSRAGVPGLTREEVGEPVGNLLNHNLIQELLMSTTLVPRDLALIEEA